MLPRAGWQNRLSALLAQHYGRVIVAVDGAGDPQLPLHLLRDATTAQRLLSKANMQASMIMDRLETNLAAAETVARTSKSLATGINYKAKGKKPKFSVVVISAMKQVWAKTKRALGTWANVNTQDVAEEAATAPLVEIVPNDAGAEIWYKKWVSMEDRKVRPHHEAAHGQVVRIEESYVVGGELLRFPGDQSLGASLGNIINCFPGDVHVSGNVVAATRHWYEGDLVEITTARGYRLAGTPNHPILTEQGWVGLGSLVQGGNVICANDLRGVDCPDIIAPRRTLDIDDAQPTIAEVFDSLQASSIAVRVPGLRVDFHGDRPTHDVDIVRANGVLQVGMHADTCQRVGKLILGGADLGMRPRLGESFLAKFIGRCLSAASRFVRSGRKSLLVIVGRAGHAQNHSFASASRGDAYVFKTPNDSTSLNSESFSNSLNRSAIFKRLNDTVANFIATGAGLGKASCNLRRVDPVLLEPIVSLGHADADRSTSLLATETVGICSDQIVDVRRKSFTGHVYNLQTNQGLYIAQGIVTHNCRCMSAFGVMRDGKFQQVGNLETVRGVARPVRRPGTKPGSAAPRVPTRAFTFATGNSRRKIILSTGETANVAVGNGAITIRVNGKPIASAPLKRDALGKFTLGPLTTAPSHQGANIQRLLDASVEATNGLIKP